MCTLCPAEDDDSQLNGSDRTTRINKETSLKKNRDSTVHDNMILQKYRNNPFSLALLSSSAV